MKITHISTSNRGGATNAAKRLHKGLLKKGVDSSFLTLNTPLLNTPKTYSIPQSYPTFFQRNIFKYLNIPLLNSQKNEVLIEGFQGDYEMFTFPDTDYDILAHPEVKNADIINLHWISNFLDFNSFFKKVNKPIVWTLHDMNPFLGGFHYSEDRKINNHVFGDLEEKLSQKKIQSIRNHDNITVVAPSKWLLNESAKSETLGIYPHHHIPYGLDTTVFKPIDKALSRSVFDLPEDKVLLLFVSEAIGTRRKGFDLLKSAILEIEDKKDVVLCAVGTKGDISFGDNIISVGGISDERLINILFSAADAFILPSREDNFPNVMLESLLAGTPVVAFPVGGILDVVKQNFNGIIAKDVSISALKEAIQLFLSNKNNFSRQAIRASSVSDYDESVQAEKYIDLYSRLL